MNKSKSKLWLWINVIKTFLPKALCRGYIQQHSLWGNSAELHSHPTFFWSNFLELYSNTFLWGNSMELYSQNIYFGEILRNCILKIFPSRQLFGFILYKSLFEEILRNCILKTFHLRQLYGVVFSQHFLFEAILRNCIIKTCPLRQFYRIVFSKYSPLILFWDNFVEL